MCSVGIEGIVADGDGVGIELVARAAGREGAIRLGECFDASEAATLTDV